MKIIFLGRYNPSENLRGPEKAAKRLFESVASRNPDTIFIEYFFDGREFNYAKKIFGAEKIVEGGKAIFRLGIVRLFFLLLKENPEIIHLVTFERFAFVAFIYKIFTKVKIVYTVHGIIFFENNYLKENLPFFYKVKDKYFEKLVFDYSDKIIFLSNISLKSAAKYLKIDKEKIEIIPNGIDECFYEVQRIPKQEKEAPLKIVFVGDYFRKEKGLDFLMNSLKDIHFPIELFIISKPTVIYDSLNSLYLKIKFIDKLEQEKYAKFLNDKDIIISSSFYENFSISVVEAMAAGLVPIVTKETGMSELIQNGVNGFVFNYGDSFMLIKLLNILSEDFPKLKIINTNVRKIFVQLSWEKIAADYSILYNRLIV